jgi:hypothetical protein
MFIYSVKDPEVELTAYKSPHSGPRSALELIKLVYQPVPPHGLEMANNYNYLSHTPIHLLHILIIVIGLVSNNFFP